VATTQPGGYYLAPNGQPHDAWNRPVEQGIDMQDFSPPVEALNAPREAGNQPIGGQIDTPFPGSDLYRAHEARMRKLADDLKAEQERFAKEQERLRKQVPVSLDLMALAQQMQALAGGQINRSASDMSVGPTREEHKAAGEAWAEREEERLEKLKEHSLAVDTNTEEPKGLEKGGQTKGESEMKDASASQKKGNSKKE